MLKQKISSTIEIYLFISIQRIDYKLRLVLQPSFFTNFKPSSSFSSTISSCENCFRIFTSTINRSLRRIQSCHSSARSRIWKRIWTYFVQVLKIILFISIKCQQKSSKSFLNQNIFRVFVSK